MLKKTNKTNGVSKPKRYNQNDIPKKDVKDPKIEQKENLYKEFLSNFPNFEKQVKTYYLHDNNALKIYTVQGGKFIFETNPDGINLKAC